jgi:uncharacterized protein (TIGR00369 family)
MAEAPLPDRMPGIVPKDVVQALNGMQFLQGLMDGRFPPAPITVLLGFHPSELAPGHAVFSATPDARHFNPLGSVHGGYVSTLLDSCMACAIHSKLRVGQGYTTIELKVSFVRALSETTGPVRAIGTVIHVGRQIARAEGRLVDSRDRLLAHATTTCLLFSLNARAVPSDSEQ